jgi:4-hydroxy-tetrahydrodipicolinate synthase
MLNLEHVTGVIPAIVTPFDADGSVSRSALSALVGRLVAGGVSGIMTTGGTGEFPHLDRSERTEVTRTCVEVAAGRVPVIAGTGACSVREAVLLCEDAARCGAEAAILVPPFYYPLPDSAIESFFDAVSDRSPLPIFLYNNPLYTGNPMKPGLMVELLTRPRIIGAKQSASDLGQLTELLYQVRARQLPVSILTGIDSQLLPALSIGAAGIFSTGAGILPEPYVELYRQATGGDWKVAEQCQARLQPLNRMLEYDPGYVAPAKEALRLLGFDVGSPRAPLPKLTENELSVLKSALDGLATSSWAESRD